MLQSTTGSRPREFIAICAFLMATIALAVDMMLPAMDLMAHDLALTAHWQKPSIILAIFAGLMVGQLFFGPLSDSIGRKPAIQLGLAIFLAGSLVSGWSQSFEMLIAGRVIQGFGAASARVVTQAMIRDCFSGRDMARAMSFVMTIFILVPILAPILGQVLLYAADWHGLFFVLAGFALLMMLWFGIRQPETLNQVQPFSTRRLGQALCEVLTTGTSMRYTLAAGISFGGLLSYLSAVQPIFQDLYQVGDWFAPLFGLTAAAIALSSLTNARLVKTLGMARISRTAFSAQVLWSGGCLLLALSGNPITLIGWLIYIIPVLFLMGLTFANLQSVAMQPMGHIAGLASTVIGTLVTGLSLLVGALFAQWFNGDVRWLVLTFFATGLIARMLISPALDASGADPSVPARENA